jgi:hypothetical protein
MMGARFSGSRFQRAPEMTAFYHLGHRCRFYSLACVTLLPHNVVKRGRADDT